VWPSGGSGYLGSSRFSQDVEPQRGTDVLAFIRNEGTHIFELRKRRWTKQPERKSFFGITNGFVRVANTTKTVWVSIWRGLLDCADIGGPNSLVVRILFDVESRKRIQHKARV
jgi:hypothetical protein